MIEKEIEKRLTTEVKKVGGIVLLPDGLLAFAELKTPGKKPRPLQLTRHRLLRSLGFKVYVIDSIEQIGGMLDELRAT